MNLIQISAELRPQAAARLAVPPTNKLLLSDCQAPVASQTSLGVALAPAPAEEEKQLMTMRVWMEPPW